MGLRSNLKGTIWQKGLALFICATFLTGETAQIQANDYANYTQQENAASYTQSADNTDVSQQTNYLSSAYTPYLEEIYQMDDTSVKLSWTVDESVNSYEVQCALDEEFSSLQRTQIISGGSCTFLDLQPEQDYYFRARTLKADKISHWSAAKQLRLYRNIEGDTDNSSDEDEGVRSSTVWPTPESTAQATEKPVKVKETPAPKIRLYSPSWTEAKNIDKTSVKLTWYSIDDADSYEVECALNENFTSEKTAQIVSGTACTFTNLKQQKYYYFRIRAKNLEMLGDWSYVTKVYVLGNSKTIKITTKKDFASIQEALNTALTNPKLKYVITVPKGKYVVTRSLQIYSNTTLNLKGVTLVRKDLEGAICLFGSGSKGKYSMGKNITIKGGVLDGGTGSNKSDICCFTHIQNITFDGITFKYMPKKKLQTGMKNTHMIEFAGSKNVMIKNCKFYNNKNCLANNEAIQLESLYQAQAGTTSAYFGKRDGTQCKNITIQNCYFSGFSYGCGSNHLNAKDHFQNIKIIKNTFVKSNKYAICLFGYRKVLIKKNKLKNCGSLVQNQNSTQVRIIK